MDWHSLNLSVGFKSGVIPRSESKQSLHIIIAKEGFLHKKGDRHWRPVNKTEMHWLDLETHSEHYLGHIANAFHLMRWKFLEGLGQALFGTKKVL